MALVKTQRMKRMLPWAAMTVLWQTMVASEVKQVREERKRDGVLVALSLPQ